MKKLIRNDPSIHFYKNKNTPDSAKATSGRQGDMSSEALCVGGTEFKKIKIKRID